VLLRLSKLLLVLALACSIGLHWTLLQAVAWTGMIATYSRSATFAQALEKTFDGQHPCKLCQEIAQGKHSQKKSEYKVELSKLGFSRGPVQFVFYRPSSFREVPPFNVGADLLAHAPPVPPPRPLPV
jgi:hypothetical protein